MPKTYGDKIEALSPVSLDDRTLTAIGRLVRACAEIEDMIDLFIASVAGINEQKTTILLGKTAIKRRIEIALELCKLRTDKALEVHKNVFGASFSDLLEIRNTVAHGKLLGVTEDGKLAFLTAYQGPTTENSAIRIVKSYLPETIEQWAIVAERDLPMLAKQFQIEELLEERLQRPLLPHSKAQRGG
tara:strand:- start:12262 stop:12822 length:561 start_codon:yes stop_codon:yes gene_type:complete